MECERREVGCGRRGRWSVKGGRWGVEGGGGGVWTEGEVRCGRRVSSFKKHMAAAVLGYRKASVGNGWANLLGLSAVTEK